ncbi:MAG: winged helix-turn-helix transcriptional regulator [Anaerolineae bacterium]|nr:winged helix-turn-helix transcriptional regulator [Anaerolineae bacterium]
MTTSRQKILTHLKKTRSASSREIARALKLSAPNVRHHLSVLCSDGRVEMTAVHNREGRGRPEKVYSLSEAALGDNLSALAEAVLTVAGSTLSMEAVASLILDESQFAGQSMNRRLALLVEKLNEMHYQARWEAGSSGPRVLFGRCPYARVIDAHPEICTMDATLLANALSRNVSTLKKNEMPAKGTCPFIFQIG